jgi:O-antigen ligase
VIIVFLLTADGIHLIAGDMKITSGRILSVAIGGLLVLWTAYRKRIRYGGVPGVLLIAWMLLSLAIDVLHVDTLPVLHHFLNLAIGVTWFFIIVNLRPNWPTLQRSIIRVGTWLGILSVVVLTARVLFIHPWGITDHFVSRVANFNRLVMFSWEPNIFGGIMALGLVMTLPFLDKSPRRYALPALLMLIALIGSLSKGPWLAFLAGFTAYVFIVRTRRMVVLYLGLILAGALVGALLLISRPELLNMSIIRPGNIDVRWIQVQYAFKDITRAPVFGNGTFSFGDLWPYLDYRFGHIQVGAAWIGQTILGVLHDTGFVGLFLFLSFWATLFYKGLRSYRCARREGMREFAYFSAAVISLQIALLTQGLATTLYALPIYWAVMGLVGCIPVWYAESTSRRMTADHSKEISG